MYLYMLRLHLCPSALPKMRLNFHCELSEVVSSINVKMHICKMYMISIGNSALFGISLSIYM